MSRPPLRLALRLPLLLGLVLGSGCGSRALPACDCPAVADPVCSTDGVDFPSACQARCAGVRVWHAGPCGGDGPAACNCPGVIDPVCGADRLTYTTACEATCAGVAIAEVGVCAPRDGGATGACQQDVDCFPRGGCFTRCDSVLDPPRPPEPDAGCQITPLPWNCTCQAGLCAVGTLAGSAVCDPARDRCAPGTMCCATCCGVSVDGGPQARDFRCLFAQGDRTCPPIP